MILHVIPLRKNGQKKTKEKTRQHSNQISNIVHPEYNSGYCTENSNILGSYFPNQHSIFQFSPLNYSGVWCISQEDPSQFASASPEYSTFFVLPQNFSMPSYTPLDFPTLYTPYAPPVVSAVPVIPTASVVPVPLQDVKPDSHCLSYDGV